jgi:hypothetical protein
VNAELNPASLLCIRKVNLYFNKMGTKIIEGVSLNS